MRLKPNKTEMRGAWTWFLYAFCPAVVLPVVVLVAIFGVSDKDIGIQELGGQGEFVFMAVALAVGAQATIRKSAALKPGGRDDSNSLFGLATTIISINSAIWGYFTGIAYTKQSYNSNFAAITGLVLLGVTILISISAAVVDARLMQSETLTVVARTEQQAQGGPA